MSPRDDASRGGAATGGVRLQKVLAAAGLGSRRACEALIDQGRVEVDGRPVREQGMRVDPQTAVIRVDGQRVPTAAGTVVVAVNKPRGVLSTMSDDRGRPCLGDLVADRSERLFHVGRLDADTEGLILLTNDGELANRLAHPSYGVAKTYLATIEGPVPRAVGRGCWPGSSWRTVRPGRRLPGRPGFPGQVLVEIVLHEGRNHIVRRMFEAVGHPVVGWCAPGSARSCWASSAPARSGLSGAEARALYTEVGL